MTEQKNNEGTSPARPGSLVPKLKRRLWQIAKLLAVVAVLGGIVYWLKFSPVPVSEHRVELGEIVAEVMGTGTLEAHFKSTISPRISGRIQEVLVDMGDSVTAGKLLVKLDDVDMKPQVEIAQASVVVSQAALDRLQADRGQALAVLEQTTADHERALRLLPRRSHQSGGRGQDHRRLEDRAGGSRPHRRRTHRRSQTVDRGGNEPCLSEGAPGRHRDRCPF